MYYISHSKAYQKDSQVLVCEIFLRPPPKLGAKSPPMTFQDALFSFNLSTLSDNKDRAADDDNLWAPSPIFVDRRVAAATDNLSARRRCHCCRVLILLQFSMTRKGRLLVDYFTGLNFPFNFDFSVHESELLL